jgi:predicted transcriptional regulator
MARKVRRKAMMLVNNELSMLRRYEIRGVPGVYSDSKHAGNLDCSGRKIAFQAKIPV